MKSIRVSAASLVLVALSASPAVAQQTEFTNNVLLKANPCFEAPDKFDPSGVINICNGTVEDLNALVLAKEAPDANEYSVFRTMISMVEVTLGTAQAQQDGFRSQRSCNTMEHAWIYASAIDPSATPSHSAEMARTTTDVAKMVRSCRAQFGAPSLAPALPPG